ncbi:cobaltochelatase subunit CobN [Glycomyces buryatensis]|uniref:Cobaltochelatase subunit CobN n=1 Tax=Glycomyces buryatensis TaxID=2570927 RepID=A0A4S8QMW9_9ACTN|nr:cobaltochelatase subunit CobN [Glycomyces buryatensis]THV42074.1 cobaltochelatase subunit CobN [Glycomyces buryatensis]
MSTILLLTTADTEILAAAGAVDRLPEGAPAVRALNPARAPQDDPEFWLDEALADVEAVVVRLLGGRAAFPDLFDALRRLCLEADIPLLALSGEGAPDAELTALSTAPTAVVAQAFEYLRLGGVDNTERLLRFLSDTLLLTGLGFEPPAELPEHGVYHPRRDDPLAAIDPDRPLIGVVFYRSHLVSGNTEFVDALIGAIEAQGAQAIGLHCYSLRPDAEGRVGLLTMLEDAGIEPDALVVTVLAMGGASAAQGTAVHGTAETWKAAALERLGVPVIQALASTGDRDAWAASTNGLSPMDTAMQIALPEFDGRIISVPFSFKEVTADDDRIGGPLVRYRPDAERTERVAGIALGHARLGRVPRSAKRIGLVLSNYPTKHSRIGNGVGLDTPASCTALLRRMRETGYDLGDVDEKLLQDGDALMHALIDRGGFDAELLTDAQLAAADAKLPVEDYQTWFKRLPEALRESVAQQWGPPPGEVLLTPDGGHLVTATLRLGNVVLAIQPPRGFGDDPVAIYHDPDLPPTHQYLAAYWWLTRIFGADAIVHVGKHGTLEWLPGKGVGLSAECATDAALTDVPLFYPFVVNDPGEGTQAKRRAHAVIVDHLVPPMMRAETYDDLTRLEQLLDEYAELELLDPAKLPAIREKVWQLMVDSEIARDLDVAEMPEDADDFGDLIVHVDGHLCEIKDLQVRDGLHILGAPPEGEQLRGLVKAILRLPQGDMPALRATVAADAGLDEAALERVELDRIDALTTALVEAVAGTGWDSGAVPAAVAAVLGRESASIIEVLRFACTEVVPRVRASAAEIDRLLSGLDGEYLPAGPSGSPTRGRLDVLPTGKNFYSVDPKGLPSQLSWPVGVKLADALLETHRERQGSLPETVGIVVWGTANMRTHGDDIAEILALLGVRPVWHEETRRVTGLEVIELEALGRPRIDVTVRISGFFRDAFPHLVALVDRAVETVAALDEPLDQNFVRAHALDDEERLRGEGVPQAQARRRSTARIFGAKPGAYGAGLLPLIDARNWRDTADLAEVFTVWSGHAYGRGLDGVEARGDLHANLKRVQVAVKNTDTREHDILDSDDYFQEHGGMIAAIRHLTGAAPEAFIGDSSDPSRPAARTLGQEVDRVFRARVVNPRWIASMRRHGYKGAFEMAATVDYMFGYDATAGVVKDWQYAKVAQSYVLDDENREFMEDSNPWALHGITERLLEAVQRGLWEEPDPELLEQIQQAHLDAEGAVEDRGEDAR